MPATGRRSGIDQSVLDLLVNMCCAPWDLWRPLHRIGPRRRFRTVVGRATRHVRAAVADRGRRKRHGRDRADEVAAILGSGVETQFQFQGILSSQKPFRDWLTEVLNCCLGFYTWEFGQLKLGCRINASAVDAYTAGNMLFQSLRLAPIQSAFEHLVLSFADVAYQYQANTAEYCDKGHAAYYGRAGSPLTSQMHSVGCSTLSQALRIAATRTREEIGGVNATEWRMRGRPSGRPRCWSGNEVGQVVSLTHPDVPTGTGKFRFQRWSLKKDWSVEIQGQTVTDSMYDLDVGPKPIDVVPAPCRLCFTRSAQPGVGALPVQAAALGRAVPE